MSAGRPRKPTQQKVLEGGRVRDDRDTHGPEVPLNLPSPPVWLCKSGKKHWETLGTQLVALGLLSAIDGDIFALHCDNVAKYGELQEKLGDLAKWVQNTPNGFEMQSAWMQIRSRLQEQIIKTGREFGLTPSARSGMRVENRQMALFVEKVENEFEELKVH